MSKTVADAINDARVLLNDVQQGSNPLRYPQADLVGHFNSAMLELYRLRPDAFFGRYDQPVFSISLSDDLGSVPFPVDGQFFTSVVFFITGMAELRDDQFTVDGRAITVMQQFTARVTGGDVQRWQRGA